MCLLLVLLLKTPWLLDQLFIRCDWVVQTTKKWSFDVTKHEYRSGQFLFIYFNGMHMILVVFILVHYLLGFTPECGIHAIVYMAFFKIWLRNFMFWKLSFILPFSFLQLLYPLAIGCSPHGFLFFEFVYLFILSITTHLT